MDISKKCWRYYWHWRYYIPLNEIPPPENTQNHAQKFEIGGRDTVEVFFQYLRNRP